MFLTKPHHVPYSFLSSCQPADNQRAAELEYLAQMLLFKFNHIRGRIKKVADEYLSKLVDKWVSVIAVARAYLTHSV